MLLGMITKARFHRTKALNFGEVVSKKGQVARELKGQVKRTQGYRGYLDRKVEYPLGASAHCPQDPLPSSTACIRNFSYKRLSLSFLLSPFFTFC